MPSVFVLPEAGILAILSFPFQLCRNMIKCRLLYALLPSGELPHACKLNFLRKISHSSQELRVDNIKGSFNGSDIMRDFMGVSNEPDNFEFLFTSHRNYTFEENLERLVEATNNIHPTSKRFSPTEKQLWCIRTSVERAISFVIR